MSTSRSSSSSSPKIKGLSSPLGFLSPGLFTCRLPSISPVLAPPPSAAAASLRSSSINPLNAYPFLSATRNWSVSGSWSDHEDGPAVECDPLLGSLGHRHRNGKGTSTRYSDYEVGPSGPSPVPVPVEECDPLMKLGHRNGNADYISLEPGFGSSRTMDKADHEYNINDIKSMGVIEIKVADEVCEVGPPGSGSEPAAVECGPLLSLGRRHRNGNYINFGPQSSASESGSSLSSSSRTMEKAEYILNIDKVKSMGESENGVEVEDEEIKSYLNLVDHDHDYYKKRCRGFTMTCRTDEDRGTTGTDDENETETTANTKCIDDDDAKFYNPDFVLFWGLRKNGSNPAKPYACPVPGCLKAYNHRNGMKYHAKYYHSAPQRFECTLCRKSYSTRTGQLQHHRRAHDPSKPKKQNEKESIKKPIKMKTVQIEKYIIVEQSCLACQSKNISAPIPIPKVDKSRDQDHHELKELKGKDYPEVMIIEKADSSKYYNYGENDDDEMVIDVDYDFD